MVSSFELACDRSVGVVDECCDSATDAIEFSLSRRQGGGSLPCNLSLPLPLDVLPGVIVLLLLLLWRNRTGSNLVLLEESAIQRRHVSFYCVNKQTCARWLRTLSSFGLLLLELMQVLHIFPIVGRLLILHQVSMVFLLICICLAFIRLLLVGVQILPIFSYELGNLCESQVLAPQVFPHFIGKQDIS
jgi:hypothetical protein